MNLEEKIRGKKINYFFKRKPETAYELAMLYFVHAKREHDQQHKSEDCSNSIHWLKLSGVNPPGDLGRTSVTGQIEEIERLLAKSRDDKRFYTLN